MREMKMRFRGDILFNGHIYWDQTSVLVQIGKLHDSIAAFNFGCRPKTQNGMTPYEIICKQ